MADLIERLRIPIGASPYNSHQPVYDKLRLEAADEIERLRALVQECYDKNYVTTEWRFKAREALGQKEAADD